MALFNKKLSLAEILKGIEALSDEEKAELKAKMQGEEVEEPEVEETEETTEEVETTEEATEEVKEEPTEESTEEAITPVETEEQVDAPTEEVQPTEELGEVEVENKEDVNTQLADRLSAVEKELEELKALKEKMEEFTKKQADKFGYKGDIPGAKKDYKDMTAEEMGRELRTEI